MNLKFMPQMPAKAVQMAKMAAQAAMVRQQHGAAGEALARALEALDQQRYAPGGQRLPDRHSAATAEREASRLRGAPGPHWVPAPRP